ncbi:MAG TPA: TIGR03618 family F420-dependent PPOX class oxidoreductase [Chloroflexota bacterium]|nr:TIGR03618 family F420-dependent PPOX class oxidoreductase [Chloroflexota bacterium]
MVVLDAAARTLLAGPNYGVLSTLMADGSPHAATVWVGVEGDHALVATTRQSQKYRNVVRDPRVALTVSEAGDPLHELCLRGRVVTIREDQGRLIDHLSEQYYGVTPYPDHEEGTEWVALVIAPLICRVDRYPWPAAALRKGLT